MTRSHTLTVAAMAASLLAGGLSAAHAQTFTVSGSVSGTAPTFTYSYLVTPGAGLTINDIQFDFSDADVLPTTTPTGFVNITNPVFTGSGIFEFYSPAGLSGVSGTFAFTSPDGVGGTLGSTAAQSAGSIVASVNGITPAPAPEPGQTGALGLGALGLAFLTIRAKKRPTVA